MSLYSTYWYRVSAIRPRLRSHVRVNRHVYRDRDWYVLLDPSTNKQYRFNEFAYFIIARMDGRKSIEEIWSSALEVLGDDAPTQDEVIQLLSKLHSADILQSDASIDVLEMFERQNRPQGQWRQLIKNPFALRFPLFDPESFLSKTVFLIKPLAGTFAGLLWLVVVGAALVQTILNWPELTANAAQRILDPNNLLILWLVYPLVKVMHEMGHAYTTKIMGGEVHEMGIVLLAFTPIPYVEASASSVFVKKHKRMAVAAAGMGVELFFASLALFAWLNIEPGFVRSIAFNVMLIGGVSTILFNGNPLLRYDGYYILADWIEIPNLSVRSKKYLGYLLQRYLFGIDNASSPVTALGEPGWFVVYGIASFIYRIFVIISLSLFVSSKFPVAGVLIAIWAFTALIVFPAIKSMQNFFSTLGGQGKKGRMVFASLLAGFVVAILFFVVPAPLTTTTQGVVVAPEDSRIRAGTDCFVAEIHATDGASVVKGDPILNCIDPFLKTQELVQKAKVREAEAEYTAAPLQSRARRDILKKEIADEKANLQRLQERLQELTISSPNSGKIILPQGEALLGRFIKQGELLGYVMGDTEPEVVVAMRQSDVALFRERTGKIRLRFVSHPETTYNSSIEREVPAAANMLPSPVLGSAGGGIFPVDPGDPRKVRTIDKIFQVELKVPEQGREIRIGERVYVLLEHGSEPLALQWLRSVRLLFLHRFHV